jgi:predicted acyltransferase
MEETVIQVDNYHSLNNDEIVEKPKKAASRILSLDCARGITVCLMIMANFSKNPSYNWLKHVWWEGWTITDLVFPVIQLHFT